jgi:hypothetical protein
VVGRLFQRLKQRIKGGIGYLVRLVKDVNFVAVARRAVAGGVTQFADLIDAAIRGGVDLDDIDCGSSTNLGAGIAYAAGFGGRPFRRADGMLAVQRHREDTGNGGFADAAVAAEDIAVGDAALFERVQKRTGDMLLPDDVTEKLGAVFAGENLIGHFRSVLLRL